MMTPVQFLFVTPEGVPIANTEFEVQLSKSSFQKDETGVVMARRIYGVTDSLGQATISLWPSDRLYHLIMEDPESCACMHFTFRVPDNGGIPVRFQDIITDVEGGGGSGGSDEDTLLLSLQFVKAQIRQTNNLVLQTTRLIENTLT